MEIYTLGILKHFLQLLNPLIGIMNPIRLPYCDAALEGDVLMHLKMQGLLLL
jgi:hypothetical protein